MPPTTSADSAAAPTCTHPATWFDRTICPPPCDSMHTRCTECDTILGHPCLYELKRTNVNLNTSLTERAHTRAMNDTAPPAFLTTAIASTPSEELREAARVLLTELDADQSEVEADNLFIRYLSEMFTKLAGTADLIAIAQDTPSPAMMEVLTVTLLTARSLVASVTAEVTE